MLLGCTVVALLLWAILGEIEALAFYCACLLVLVLRDRLHLRALVAWLGAPTMRTLPEARGFWGEAFYLLGRLLKHQRQSERSLVSALESFQQAGAAMPDGLIILRRDDRIEWCNPRAEQHFGLLRSRDVGQQVTYLVRAPQFAQYLRSHGRSEPLVLRMTRAVDEAQVLAIQLVPFGDQNKLVLSRDITQLESVETVRRDFVANVSHELRTPLTVVIGFLETVLDMKAAAPAAQRPLELAMEQAVRMQRLVEDLLTLSRLEGAHNPLREDPVDVQALLRAVHQEALALSAGRHRIQLDSPCPAWVMGNADELRSAFGNLVSNAIRYTPAGGEVRLAWQADDGRARFVVQDSGIGIEPQHIPRLTERFYRVDRSRSRETGGTGLGLAIVKHVLGRHGARLEVTSEPGKGSRFAVLFPQSRVIEPPEKADRAA